MLKLLHHPAAFGGHCRHRIYACALARPPSVPPAVEKWHHSQIASSLGLGSRIGAAARSDHHPAAGGNLGAPRGFLRELGRQADVRQRPLHPHARLLRQTSSRSVSEMMLRRRGRGNRTWTGSFPKAWLKSEKTPKAATAFWTMVNAGLPPAAMIRSGSPPALCLSASVCPRGDPPLSLKRESGDPRPGLGPLGGTRGGKDSRIVREGASLCSLLRPRPPPPGIHCQYCQ